MSTARILIVEDEAIIAMELEDRLTRAGHTVVGHATAAAGAVELAHAQRPDVVLMDVHLGAARDGVSVARELRERFGVAVVFVTAHADAATRARCDEAGATAYITKPLRPEELHAAIARAVAARAKITAVP